MIDRNRRKLYKNKAQCPACGKKFRLICSHLQRSPECLRFVESALTKKRHFPTQFVSKSSGKKKSFNPLVDNTVFSPKTVTCFPSKDILAFPINVQNKVITPLENNVYDFSNSLSQCSDDLSSQSLDVTDSDASVLLPQCSEALSLQHLQFQRNRSAILDPQVVFLNQLLKLLNDTDSPLNLYEKIMNWAVHSVSNGFSFRKDYPSRQVLIKTMSSACCLQDLVPKQHLINLKTSGMTNVSLFDFEQVCFSLLSQPSLMQDDNMSFPNDHPCSYIRQDRNTLSCIEDGDMYQSTAASVCRHNNDFCLGIKLFIDATHTDVHSNWMLDPVMMTFTFFKNKVTRSKDAWRTLGFITHTNQKSKNQNTRVSSPDKIQDYHTQLELILASIKKCQDKGGFRWCLRFENKLYHVRMIPVVMLIIGDAQGNHKLAGMYGKFFKTSRVNHSCSCKWVDTDNPKIQCSFVKQSTIRMLCTEGLGDELRSISQHNITNAFDSICVGTHEAGINAMMPAEILHQLFLGVFQYVIEDFFSKYSALALSRIDDIGVIIHRFGKRNSDRSIPSFSSRNGFTTLTKKSGTDIIGIGLLCFLVLSMDVRNSLLESCSKGPTDETMDQFQILFQDLLIYSEWLCENKYSKSLLDECHLKIQSLMTLIRKLVTRKSDNGLKLSKFHEMLHVCRDIRLFGPPDGYDGRPGESAHKFTKTNARKTQRRKHVFEKQTCDRMYESIVIDSFHNQRVMVDNPDLDFLKCKSIPKTDSNRQCQYYIFTDKNGNICSSLVSNNWTEPQIQKHIEVVTFVYNHINLGYSWIIPCKTLLKMELDDATKLCRELDLDDNGKHLFHSHPFFNKEEWYDWAYIRWYDNKGDEFDVPSQIFSFVDLRDVDIDDQVLSEKGLSKSIYACIRSLNESPKKCFSRSKIIFQSKFEDITNTYRLVEVSTISDRCYVIPNIKNRDDVEHEEWILLENRYTWGSHFH